MENHPITSTCTIMSICTCVHIHEMLNILLHVHSTCMLYHNAVHVYAMKKLACSDFSISLLIFCFLYVYRNMCIWDTMMPSRNNVVHGKT